MIRDGKVLFDNHTADSYDKRKRMITHKERDDGYRIVNCPKLKTIQIGNQSFGDYHSFELKNLPSLQSIDVGSSVFSWTPIFSLTGLID